MNKTAVAAAIAAVVILPVAGIYGVGFLKKETADFRGGVSATESVKANGAYRIAAYDQFFDLCGQVQAKEGTIAILQEELLTATPERAAVITPTIAGIKAGRQSDIAQYNSDASKTDTKANFLASSLPYSLNINQETTCAIN
jgi:hypothetical protein